MHARALRSSPLTSRVYHYRLTRLRSQARLLPAHDATKIGGYGVGLSSSLDMNDAESYSTITYE
jgi:hypothetical protein